MLKQFQAPQLKDFSGFVQHSGEGRWTIEAAIEEAVPADVLTTALYFRSRSRQEHTFGENSLSAMRFGFGGHKALAPNQSRADRRAARRHRRSRSSTMSDAQPIRIPPTARVIESPPRRQSSPADPCAMVIFGAGGDLTKRLVVPALYNLSRTKVLPEKFALIGADLAEGSAESWRDHLYDMLKSFVGNAAAEFDVDRIDEAAWRRVAEKMSYVQGDLTKPELHEKIRAALDRADKIHGTQGNAIFYLAVADRFFGTVVEQLGNAKLAHQDEDKDGKRHFWRRVVIEKPFGHSLESARELNARILRTLREDQIFRINPLRPNWLVLCIAPDEGISLQFEVKCPGPVVDLAALKMDFHYDDWFQKEPNVGYETLIYDVMIGDPTLFMRADMVEQAWRIVQPLLDAWTAEKADFPNYDSGSDGPNAADELLARDGRRVWRPMAQLSEHKT
jgi:glucose-6-phosphate 1-dehydrogenase